MALHLGGRLPVQLLDFRTAYLPEEGTSMLHVLPNVFRTTRAGLLMAAVTGSAFLATLTPTGLAAQATGTVRGTIVEAGTNRPLLGVQVFIKGTTRGRLTDASGAYVIPGVPVGPTILRVESIGYRTAEQSITVSTD